MTLPDEVERWIVEASERPLTGSITLHFVGGQLRTWERKETGREKGRIGERLTASASPS